ncbi:type 4a pilus biogenesis protein PilO [Marinicellulosiphila megalodicopiae]|uniref:type 4a pilus biogenesis protein PilO n=1 Tax=Marinicellulosiphila megalodicopiae TaxID=2724896 RepID=UPI003BAF3994
MNAKKMIDELKHFDVNTLNDPQTWGTLPVIVKGIFCILLIAIVFAAGYFGIIKKTYEDIETQIKNEANEMKTLKVNAGKAAGLERLKEQLSEVEAKIQDFTGKLPKVVDIPGMMDDLNSSATENGLEMGDYNFLKSVQSDEYKVSPVTVNLKGSYHEFGTWMSSAASLPRIVTLHDFTIKKRNNSDVLDMVITAKTYSSKDEE